MDWKRKLATLVTYYQTHDDLVDPFFLYDPQPASDTGWPDELPRSESLKAFYTICGGGEFGPMIRFTPLERLARETAGWIDTLKDYDARGDVLVSGTHVVFANDADGTPWVLDAHTDGVASFYWKGGDWQEPRFASFAAFMNHVFEPSADDASWAEVLGEVLEP